MSDVPEPRPAATVVLLRDTVAGPEVLLLKRNKALVFAGGFWVFPGGALDPEDWRQGNDEATAARHAAAREAMEESGLRVDPDLMVQISHWTTPVAEPKRFYTWFFLARAGDEQVAIDGSEIHDHCWVTVNEAVQRHEAGDMGMFPPTIMTLRALSGYLSAEDALIGMASRDPYRVLPVFASQDDTLQVLLEGDAGYAAADPASPGARHRMQLRGQCWHYCVESLPEEQARLDG